MKAPAFAGSVDNVERLGVLKIQMLDLPLKRVGRVGREQFALDGAEDRKSGPSERVLDFTARVRFHVVLQLIAAERSTFRLLSVVRRAWRIKPVGLNPS